MLQRHKTRATLNTITMTTAEEPWLLLKLKEPFADEEPEAGKPRLVCPTCLNSLQDSRTYKQHIKLSCKGVFSRRKVQREARERWERLRKVEKGRERLLLGPSKRGTQRYVYFGAPPPRRPPRVGCADPAALAAAALRYASLVMPQTALISCSTHQNTP
jgi:hypothetical protein